MVERWDNNGKTITVVLWRFPQMCPFTINIARKSTSEACLCKMFNTVDNYSLSSFNLHKQRGIRERNIGLKDKERYDELNILERS